MADLGYSKDSGVRLICKSANRDPEGLERAVKALLAEHVDVIVATSQSAAEAVERQSRSVPLIARRNFTFVSSLSQPGVSSSGIFDCAYQLTAKRMELLRDALPGLRRVAILFRPGGTVRENIVASERAARRLSLEFVPVPISAPSEIGPAFDRMVAAGVEAVFILPDLMIEDRIAAIAGLASERKLPTMAWESRLVRQGILMAYSCNADRAEERLASYVDKFLTGTPVGRLPIGQTTDFTFAVNQRIAASLGVVFPPAVLLFADELVE
ncbi:MAG: ABC transporter substrate-binding protein [Paracoccaceae bacterium]